MSGGDRLFLPWLRRGLAGGLEAPARGVIASARGDLTVRATIAAGTGPSALTERPAIAIDGLVLMGPGDVTGLGPGAVRRTEPSDGTADMFPNLMPTVEFAQPDLPWAFTPAGANSKDRLTPWIVLVCVEDGSEGTVSRDAAGHEVLTIDALPSGVSLSGTSGILPDPKEAWAWAHVQISGIVASDHVSVAQIEDRLIRPEALLSRLICPRNLKPRTRYVCAVVPVFEAGRRAGLGLDPVEDGSFAWGATTALPLLLPCFHTFRFATAQAGDFESMARLLTPVELGPDVGRRTVDVQDPGLPLELVGRVLRPPAADIPATSATDAGGAEGAPRELPFPVVAGAVHKTLEIGGALRPVRKGGPVDPPDDPLGPALEVVARTTRAPDGAPLVGPPIYGRWAAGQVDRGLPAAAPDWLETLATTTAHRAAAGAGARIVRDKQDELMEEVWSQYQAVAQVNALLDRSRLSRALNRSVLRRHLEVDVEFCESDDAVPDRIWDTLSPVMGRLARQGRNTLAHDLRDVPEAPPGPALRRASAAAPPPRNVTGAANARRDRQDAIDRGDWSWRDERLDTSDRDITALEAEALEELGTIWPDAFIPGTGAPPDWGDVRATLCAALDSAETQAGRAKAHLGPDVGAHQPGTDPLHPVVATPDLPRPAYLDLAALSQDWMLPGLDRVPANGICLLEPDTAFIEAHMAGLNHELEAEMLWRGFPTDRGGTPLRTFWDRRGGSAPRWDIAAMRDWGGDLGSHAVPETAPGTILLLRGDLLRRFPQTLIYAQPAAGDPAVVDETEKPILPLFRGRLDPDVTFLGFPMNRRKALEGGPNDKGYFFVIEGPPIEPRFGLDETLLEAGATSVANPHMADAAYDWDPLAWGDLLPPGSDLASIGAISHVPVTAPPEASLTRRSHNRITWGANAAHMAAITLQVDTRVALHAKTLIGSARP